MTTPFPRWALECSCPTGRGFRGAEGSESQHSLWAGFSSSPSDLSFNPFRERWELCPRLPLG